MTDAQGEGNRDPQLTVRRIEALPGERLALQRVLEAAPTYSLRVSGKPPTAAEAEAMLEALPPGIGPEDKFNYGIYLGSEMVGCIDLIRGYPSRRTAMLGLFLLSERVQGQGLGKRAYQLLEDIIHQWAGIDTIRIGVVASNGQVIPFWEKMGFKDTGVRKLYEEGSVVSENRVFEKKLVPQKARYAMRAVLQEVPLEPRNGLRRITLDDADSIGRLMERSYLGTIDYEGETTEQFIQEVRATIRGKYGPFVQEASFVLEENGEPVSVTIVTQWKDKPLLAFSSTNPKHQGKGLARYLIRRSMNEVFALGYPLIELGVTVGNAPAEHLYRKLGFERVV